MGPYITGAIVSGVLLVAVHVADNNVPNSLAYWVDLYSPF